MQGFFRFLGIAAAALLAQGAAFAQASVQVRGTVKNIPFPTSCPASGNTVYAFQNGSLQVTFSCNNINYVCQALPLKDNPDQLVSLTLGASASSPSTLTLNCGISSTVQGLQVFISDFHPTLSSYMLDPTSQQPDRHCLLVAGRSVKDTAYYPPNSVFTFNCADTVGDTNPEVVSCFMVSDFSYDSGNTTLLVPRCIDASVATNSPLLFRDDYEEVAESVLGAQAIVFNDPGAQTYAAGGTFSLTATGGSSGNPVVFASTTEAVCTVSGRIVTMQSAGSCILTANQAGNLFYAAAPVVTRTVTIARASQTIAFTSPGNQTYAPGGTFNLAATGGASGNPVVFASITPSVCTVAGSVASIVAAGTCTISALQGGNANYLAASPVSVDVQIARATQTISFTAPGDHTGAGTFTVTATASSGLTVTVTSATPSVCTVAGLTVTPVSDGTCTLRANQAGNENYLAAPEVARDITLDL